MQVDEIKSTQDILNWIRKHNISNIVNYNNAYQISQEAAQKIALNIIPHVKVEKSFKFKHNDYVDVLIPNHNRLHSFKRTFDLMEKNTKYPYKITIIDDGSSDEKVFNYMFGLHDKSVVDKVFLVNKNTGLTFITNLFWNYTKSSFMCKIDNDISVPANWLTQLMNTHNEAKDQNLIVVGLCHFEKEDINLAKLQHNVHMFKKYGIVRQFHIGGNYVANKHLIKNLGFIPYEKENTNKKASWSKFQSRFAYEFKYLIGYIYPMDFWLHNIEWAELHQAYIKKSGATSTLEEYIDAGKKWNVKLCHQLLHKKYDWPK